jgi:Fe-S-cluster formation regulator IscX/YfhJ
MTDKQQLIQELLDKKTETGDERDLCAELYNIWITRLHDFQEDPIKYKMYLDLIAFMEPYGNKLKEEIAEINRKLCDLDGVESIAETNYVRECNNTHGLAMPNAKHE